MLKCKFTLQTHHFCNFENPSKMWQKVTFSSGIDPPEAIGAILKIIFHKNRELILRRAQHKKQHP
jgi:hypothetical protein